MAAPLTSVPRADWDWWPQETPQPRRPVASFAPTGASALGAWVAAARYKQWEWWPYADPDSRFYLRPLFATIPPPAPFGIASYEASGGPGTVAYAAGGTTGVIKTT